MLSARINDNDILIVELFERDYSFTYVFNDYQVPTKPGKLLDLRDVVHF